MTTSSTNMAALNSCIEEEKEDWSMATNLLPEDILVEILARLPVKSLLRFRSFSKSWRDMVKEPFFITKHHLTQVSLNNGNCVVTMAHNNQRWEHKFVLLTKAEQEIKFTILEMPFSLESLPIDMELERRHPAYQVSGPCNGLLLVSKWYDDRLFIWNPATREYKAFPPASLSLSWSDIYYRASCNVGFGIDPITKDYKVVRTWKFYVLGGNVNEEGNSINKSEVFSLSSNSSRMWPKGGCESWRIIDDVPPVPLDESSNGGVYLNGRYYWYSEMHEKYTCRIVWFDMGVEVFGLVELPDSLSNDYVLQSRITTIMFKEGELSLAVIRYKIEIGDKHTYKIWIIDEEGFSWTKYATVGSFSIYEVPLGFFGKNEELFVFNSNDEFVVFNSSYTEEEGNYMLQSRVYTINTHVKKKMMLGLYFDTEHTLTVYNETLLSVL